MKRAGMAVTAGTLGIVVALVFLNLFGNRLIAIVAISGGRVSGALKSRMEEIGQNFLGGIAGLFNPRTGAVFLALTAIIWALEVATAYLVCAAFNLSIPLGNLLFVLIAIAVGTLVPSSPGYVGTFEFFGVNAMSIIGISGGEALSFVVTLHAIAILGSGILGAVCLVGWGEYPVATRAKSREQVQ